MIEGVQMTKEENLQIEDKKKFLDYVSISKLNQEELLNKYQSKLTGLSKDEAHKRLITNGPNKTIKEDKRNWAYFFFRAFQDHFIIILLILAVINFSLGDQLGSLIIVLIAVASATIRFAQDYSVFLFNKKLKAKIFSTANVIREDTEENIKTEKVVVGDIVKLNAGSIVPADIIILDSKDLFVNQSTFTGESVPVAKLSTDIGEEPDEIFSIDNICLMNSSIISGSATALVINTGFNTYLGTISDQVVVKKDVTNFDKGMSNITNLLIKYMVVVCLVVLVIDGVIKNNISEAILFALSVAVGITPSMLPMIVNVNLTKGTKSLAKKKTLVKRIESIQNLGAIDILCTDKTGTLTENNIILQKYIDVEGKENNNIVEYAYLNSYYGTGMKNLVDRAIIAFGKENKIDEEVKNYVKVDELPFDYSRRKMSVVVKSSNRYRMLTKGAIEEILKSCSKVRINGKDLKIDEHYIKKANEKAIELADSGMQVIALAEKDTYPGPKEFNASCEKEMTFVGLVGFLDPPKKDAQVIINKLREVGVHTKILTGDNPYATKFICTEAGLDGSHIMLGSEIDKLTDKKLAYRIEQVDIFARLNPLQKERVVSLYKKNGHVVGYMGDGVNDAPSLKKADIGISVNSATDIAKEASDIILLERSLKVIYDGVIEGRKVYGNIIKYMKMALSGDFGDVFSIMVASIFLPFLPLLPIQMLLQDFIYDFSQIGIPYDNVDDEFLKEPKKWDTKGISRFMKVMGITSSIVDVISFVIFWFVLGYNNVNKAAYFQTAWFVTCLITELMIIYNVRTKKKPFIESNASKPLMLLTILSMILTIITPILLSGIKTFHYVILPPIYYAFLVMLVLLYFVLVSLVKKIYINKYHEWL
jgi:Mg2+-importing ATPase